MYMFIIEFPRAKTYPSHQPRGGLHQQSRTHDDVKKELKYENIPEEQSSQARKASVVLVMYVMYVVVVQP